jgi:NadR type nicotinamide-nucleotide adenylyltransferase
MKEMFPDVEVVHLTDENPQYPHEHTDFWEIWRASIRKFIPSGPDYVFASEDYGFRLAEVLGAEYVPVDHARELVPVSATEVREDPMRHWDFLPPCVRPHFVRKVCVCGPESTGKSTLAARLARHFETVHVHEYARGLIDLHNGEVTEEMFVRFVRAQAAAERALATQARRVLVCDTDAFTTALYHELYVGGRPDYALEEAARHGYDLYLLCDMDTPYIEDGQRLHPGKRKWFLDEYLKWIDSRGGRAVMVRGDWEERFRTARTAVEELIAHEKDEPGRRKDE